MQLLLNARTGYGDAQPVQVHHEDQEKQQRQYPKAVGHQDSASNAGTFASKQESVALEITPGHSCPGSDCIERPYRPPCG